MRFGLPSPFILGLFTADHSPPIIERCSKLFASISTALCTSCTLICMEIRHTADREPIPVPSAVLFLILPFPPLSKVRSGTYAFFQNSTRCIEFRLRRRGTCLLLLFFHASLATCKLRTTYFPLNFRYARGWLRDTWCEDTKSVWNFWNVKIRWTRSIWDLRMIQEDVSGVNLRAQHVP